MKRAMFSILTVVTITVLCGCAHHRRPWAGHEADCVQATEGGEAYADNGADDSGACPERGCLRKHHCPICSGARQQAVAADAGQGGSAMGAVAYPYYTTRGPRDFLARNPASIGP